MMLSHKLPDDFVGFGYVPCKLCLCKSDVGARILWVLRANFAQLRD
jgi:hypothetical protein